MNPELQDLTEENTRLRAALAQSPGACHYCQLPKEQWATCKSGFPGCARADDAFGCPEIGAMVEYAYLRDLCCRLIATCRDPARENWWVSGDVEEIAEAIGYNEKRDSK